MSKELMVKTGNMQMTEAEFNAYFDPASMADDLSAGVSSGFGIISIRGSKWRVKKGGEETPVLDANGDPVARLEVVILKAAKAVSKTFYAGAFVEGSTEEPDCSSNDGVKPDAGCSDPQSKTCAACPQNEWGSRVTEAGKKAKNCSDTRRVAVLLADDLAGANFDGPLMLRVPPASLTDLAIYGKRMAQKNHPYRIIVTALGFDLDTAFPKLTFKAVRPLGREDQVKYVHFLADGTVDNILNTKIESNTKAIEQKPEPQKTVDTDFEQPVAEAAPDADEDAADADAEAAKKAATAAKRKATIAKKKAAEAALAAKPAPAVSADVAEMADGLDDALDDMLKDMDS